MPHQAVENGGMQDLAAWYRQIQALRRGRPGQEPLLLEAALTPKWVIVWGGGPHCGLAFRFAGEHAVYGHLDYDALFQTVRSRIGRPLAGLVEYLLTLDGLCARGLCLAALHALSAPLNQADALAERGWTPGAPAALPFLRAEDRVVCVGYGGLVREVLAVCPQVHISDMRPRSELTVHLLSRDGPAGPEGVVFHPAWENARLLAQADVVLLTGSTLVNGTWRSLIGDAAQARVIGLFGPSAGLPPEVLNAMGVRYVTASRILEPARMLAQLRRPGCEPLSAGCAQGYSLLL